MAVTITIPAAAAQAKVRVTQTAQTICAKGTASRAGGVNPTAVSAKVYAADPGTPASPPAGATAGNLDTADTWSFTGVNEIPGAACAAAPAYPTNWLAVWAKFDDTQNPYDVSVITFLGLCSTSTDCTGGGAQGG